MSVIFVLLRQVLPQWYALVIASLKQGGNLLDFRFEVLSITDDSVPNPTHLQERNTLVG